MPVSEGELAWNERIIADLREHEGQVTTQPLAGAHLLLLASTGARSGLTRIAPLGYTRDGDAYVVVGSNSGGPLDPAWLANVTAHPLVSVEADGETFPARARVTEGSERRRLFDAHAAAIPIFRQYEAMTEREIPVVRLERIDAGVDR